MYPCRSVTCVRLAVDLVEFQVDLLFLPEVLRNRDPAHRLLDRLVDIGHRPLGAGRGRTRDLAERQSHAHDHRGNCQSDQRQFPVAVEEKGCHEDQQQNLARQIERERNHVGEIIGIRRHPGNDSPRLLLVEKRHVAPHHGPKGIVAQPQHHIADHLRRARLAHIVETPRERPGDEDGKKQHPDPPAEHLFGAVDLIDGARDQHRQQGIHGGIEDDHDDDQPHCPSIRFEVPQNALDKSTIIVRSVVRLGVEALHDEAHAAVLRPIPDEAQV